MAAGPATVDLSVCIVSFNTRSALEDTLRAAQAAAGGLAAEWIVIDNGSTDGSARMVVNEFPGARLVLNAANHYFSAGNNQALALCSGRYVLMLNSDAVVRPGTLAKAVGFLDEHPEIGAATVQMHFPDGHLQRTCARFSSFAYLLLEHTLLGQVLRGRRRRLLDSMRYEDWDRTTAREVDVLPGSFLLARREVIETVGGFDESLRLYFSDDDWCKRLQLAGLRAAYLPIDGVVHPEGTSVRRVASLARRVFFEDLVTYTRKYFGRPRALWLWLLSWPTRGGLALAEALRGGRG